MLEREIGEILGTIRQMSERLNRLEERFNHFENRFNHLENRFNHLENRFNRFENRVETRFNHLLVIIITMWVTLGGLMLGMLLKEIF